MGKLSFLSKVKVDVIVDGGEGRVFAFRHVIIPFDIVFQPFFVNIACN